MLTDYPDPVLIDNLEINVSNNIPLAHGKKQSVQVKVRTHVPYPPLPPADSPSIKGYIWGHPVAPLLEAVQREDEDAGFDLVIMSDLLFNHSQVS